MLLLRENLILEYMSLLVHIISQSGFISSVPTIEKLAIYFTERACNGILDLYVVYDE